MAKRKETLEIEEHLYRMTKAKRLYGCSEVTIGFYNNGHGNEIVDFCTMDSRGTIKCYEIKVSLADFKSKAKKSWYGHYNYLVVTKDLYNKLTVELIDEYIPKYVGIVIPYWDNSLEVMRRAKKQDLTKDDEIMMKESLVRTLSHKLIKIRNANNLEFMSKLNSLINRLDKELKNITDKYTKLHASVGKFEMYLEKFYDTEFDIEQFSFNYRFRDKELPESINLQLNEYGKKYNEKVNDFKF